ncbi:MAG: zinc dependent phospholipase C family protein [Chloroflexota bacterium]|nr:zinc dependent phospholipase C family protein [Chloroflexota bacterium]
MRVALAALEQAPDSLRSIAHAAQPAYYAGAIAPDARVRNEAAREATHFYSFRDSSTWGTATRRLFSAYPELADPASLTQSQTAFVAGYLTHLAADEVFVVRLGEHAVQGDGSAIGGLSWAIEAGSPQPPHGLAAAFQSLAGFRADGLTTIADSELLERKAAGVSTIDPGLPLGELRRAIVALNELEVSSADSAREVELRAAIGRNLFGPKIAVEFLAAAEAEAIRRLRAFAAGTAAAYDASHLSDFAG